MPIFFSFLPSVLSSFLHLWKKTTTTCLLRFSRDSRGAASGQSGVVVYLRLCDHRDPLAIHEDSPLEPGETRQGRKERFPINSGNWYKQRHHTIQSPFLFYWPPCLTHATDSEILCFQIHRNTPKEQDFFHFLDMFDWGKKDVMCYKTEEVSCLVSCRKFMGWERITVVFSWHTLMYLS